MQKKAPGGQAPELRAPALAWNSAPSDDRQPNGPNEATRLPVTRKQHQTIYHYLDCQIAVQPNTITVMQSTKLSRLYI